MQLVLARNYIENLREEVKKGMREKAEQGIYPGRAPLGYRNNRADRTIEVHPENAVLVRRIFELYASGQCSLSQLKKAVREECGKSISRAYLHTILTNPFYLGNFSWGGHLYRGTHASFIGADLYERVQMILRGHNKPKYRKQEFAFRGLLQCAQDHCAITAERKKEKYVYYRCTGYRGKCSTPRFTEPEMAEKLGIILKEIQIPDPRARKFAKISRPGSGSRPRTPLPPSATHCSHVWPPCDAAWTRPIRTSWTARFRKTSGNARWQSGRLRSAASWTAITRMAQPTNERLLTAQRTLELANKAYSLYLTRNSEEQAQLLRMVLLNCAIDGTSVQPTYRKPFDLIFERGKTEDWSGRADLNCRPLAPQASALPG